MTKVQKQKAQAQTAPSRSKAINKDGSIDKSVKNEP